MWSMLQDMRIGIYELDKQESFLHLAKGVHRQQGEDSHILRAQLIGAKVALARRRPSDGPADRGAIKKKALKLECIYESLKECKVDQKNQSVVSMVTMTLTDDSS